MKPPISVRCIFLLSLIFCGCATVPTVRVAQPWIRSLDSHRQIQPGKAIKIEVTGATAPLLGNEELMAQKLRFHLSYLISRRGFRVEDNLQDYLLRLSYKTVRTDKLNISSSVASSNLDTYMIATGSGAGATSGLGVSIARAVSALTSRSTTVATQSAAQTVSYTHTISIEISDHDGGIIWKGESTWDSSELNLISRIIPSLQLLLSDLPADRTVRPEVSEVKESHVVNYYRLECEDVWFTCPALPYRILFSEKRETDKQEVSIPSSINNPYALATYTDLIQTAEFALPDGNEKDWIDPLQISLWKRTTLGGQYILSSSKKPINIIIKLVGKTDGYYVDDCRVVSDKEFSDFNARLSRWRQMLQDYYDVYVR